MASLLASVWLFFAIVVIPISIQALENSIINEDDLFSDSETVVDSKSLSDESIALEVEKPGFSLTGSVYNTNWYSTHRNDYILKSPFIEDDDTYTGDITANILIDGRYKAGIKGFANLDFIYYSQGIKTSDSQDTKYTDQFVRELFVDLNINRAVYFRLGKQFLKWGRNYFWNPTDLINVERKSFLDLDRNLEGTHGIKAHIPFGTKYNIYFFMDLDDVDVFQDIAWSGKFEFLVGNTEMGLSMWYKHGYKPVYGFDFSTRIFRLDVQGEMSLSYGENQNRLISVTDDTGNISYTTIRRDDQWIPRASIGITKSFDLLDVNDRVTVRSEFFYNDAGYGDNMFDDPKCILALLSEGLYEPNYVSTYYASLFTSVRQFIISDMILNLNAIGNLTDGSGILAASLLFNPWYDAYIELTTSAFIGDGGDEYTFAGRNILMGLEFRYQF